MLKLRSVGAIIFGYIITFLGRRLTMLVSCVFGGAIVPAYVSPRNMSLQRAHFLNSFSLAVSGAQYQFTSSSSGQSPCGLSWLG
jgi:hypothetical protein